MKFNIGDIVIPLRSNFVSCNLYKILDIEGKNYYCEHINSGQKFHNCNLYDFIVFKNSKQKIKEKNNHPLTKIFV